MEIYFNSNGHSDISIYNDWDGNPVERTTDKYMYSYDPYVLSKKSDDYRHAVYSDRLFQYDYEKHNILCKRHFGNDGQVWDNRSNEKIEAFLQDYFGNPKLELVGIMKGCNMSSGHPYWIFMYNDF